MNREYNDNSKSLIRCTYNSPIIIYSNFYLLLGGNSLISKYTGQILEPDDLKIETPSVLNFKDKFSG